MNREELLNLLEKIDLPLGEYCVCSSGSLVIRGIKEKAGDLDLQVSWKCYDYIKDNFRISLKEQLKEFDPKLYVFEEFEAEFFVVDTEELNFDYVDGYPCQNLDDILEFKKRRNLPKDRIDIEKILNFNICR